MVIVIVFFTNTGQSGASATTTDEAAESVPELTEEEKRLNELRQSIADKNAEIKQIEAEIEQYKKQITATGEQATTLKSAIKKLESTKAKLTADISLTAKKIQATTLSIQEIGIEINEKKDNIEKALRTLKNAMQAINEAEMRTPVEVLLANENFYDSWNDFENMQKFQGSLNEELGKLKSMKRELEYDKTKSEQEKKNLTSLKVKLSDQQKIVDQNKKEKNQLLTQTKNQETEYKKMLGDRLAKKDQLEQEILEFESKLKADVDTTRLPKAGSGVLAWPLDSIRITQYFGKTAFATKNPQVYNGAGHNGVDFGASVGTPIKSSADGVVVDTGNTDEQCYGVSYGKWVLIRHPNGLSTLYAHLSLIKVSKGESVTRGEVIGYSGNTGYSTGPHLHLTVYASQAVHISGPTEYKSKVCKTYMKLPLAPKNGYLNPLSYL